MGISSIPSFVLRSDIRRLAFSLYLFYLCTYLQETSYSSIQLHLKQSQLYAFTKFRVWSIGHAHINLQLCTYERNSFLFGSQWGNDATIRPPFESNPLVRSVDSFYYRVFCNIQISFASHLMNVVLLSEIIDS